MDRDGWAADWIGEYLEWMEAATVAAAVPLLAIRAGIPRAAGNDGDAFPAEREQFRETVLMDALRIESECVHILSRLLDNGEGTPEKVALALDTLREANDLLADESRAWHALRTRRQWQLALSPIGAWETQLDYQWSAALDHVAADVHALAGRVIALHSPRA